jgi:type II secretory ATPase GspE/PulE/Tfp pilus assembly ATPase PilB-like protein
MDLNNCSKRPYEQNTHAQDIVALVEDFLVKAVECGASDVHFEPTGAARYPTT